MTTPQDIASGEIPIRPLADLAIRIGLYGLLLWLARHYPVVLPMLAGVLLGDVVTWILTLFLRARCWVTFLDLVFWVLIVRFWLQAGGQLALPASLEDRAVFGLAFLMTFAVKFLPRLRHDPDDD